MTISIIHNFPVFCQSANFYPFIRCFISFSSNSTSIISGPIRITLAHGIKNSLSLQKQPRYFPGPGTISARILPHSLSMSRSRTLPRQRQSFTLTTSFSHKYAQNTPAFLSWNILCVLAVFYVYARCFISEIAAFSCARSGSPSLSPLCCTCNAPMAFITTSLTPRTTTL